MNTDIDNEFDESWNNSISTTSNIKQDINLVSKNLIQDITQLMSFVNLIPFSLLRQFVLIGKMTSQNWQFL